MRRGSPEADLQRAVRDTLATLGYTVMETGKGRSRITCAKCGAKQFATGWQGNTPGLPDIYIHKEGWQMPLAIALELKAPKGQPTEEQRRLAATRQTAIVRSIAGALEQVRAVESRLGNDHMVKRIDDVITLNGWNNNA